MVVARVVARQSPWQPPSNMTQYVTSHPNSKFHGNRPINLPFLAGFRANMAVARAVARQSPWQPPSNMTHVTSHPKYKFHGNRPVTLPFLAGFRAKMAVARVVARLSLMATILGQNI